MLITARLVRGLYLLRSVRVLRGLGVSLDLQSEHGASRPQQNIYSIGPSHHDSRCCHDGQEMVKLDLPSAGPVYPVESELGGGEVSAGWSLVH